MAVLLMVFIGVSLPAAWAGEKPTLGDLNCDQRIDLTDVKPFIVALKDPGGWCNAYGQANQNLLARADFNGDGRVTTKDIPGFGDLLRKTLGGGGDGGGDGGGEGAGGPDVECACCVIDLDVDSDNNNGVGFPDRSGLEDDMEDCNDPNSPCYELYHDEPGKFVQLNDDYDNTYTPPAPDCEHHPSESIPEEQGELVPIVLYLNSCNCANPRITLSASPAVVLDPNDPNDGGYLRLLNYPTRGGWREFETEFAPEGDLGDVAGDMDWNGTVEVGDDTTLFILALTNPAGYIAQYSGTAMATNGGSARTSTAMVMSTRATSTRL